MVRLGLVPAALLAIWAAGGTARADVAINTFPVPPGSGAHDVYPAADGTVWFKPRPPASSAGSIRGPANRQ